MSELSGRFISHIAVWAYMVRSSCSQTCWVELTQLSYSMKNFSLRPFGLSSLSLSHWRHIALSCTSPVTCNLESRHLWTVSVATKWRNNTGISGVWSLGVGALLGETVGCRTLRVTVQFPSSCLHRKQKKLSILTKFRSKSWCIELKDNSDYSCLVWLLLMCLLKLDKSSSPLIKRFTCSHRNKRHKVHIFSSFFGKFSWKFDSNLCSSRWNLPVDP